MSCIRKPNTTFNVAFVTIGATGAAVNADALPSVVCRHNGVDDATCVVSVVNKGTGQYNASGTVPAGYDAGDDVQLVATATIAGVAACAVIESFRVETQSVSEAAAASVWTPTVAGRIDAAVSSRATLAAQANQALDATVAKAETVATAAGQALQATAAQAAAIQEQTDKIGTTAASYRIPMAVNGGDLPPIVAGCDYLDADGRAIEISISGYTGPDLSQATASIRLIRWTEYQRDAAAAADLEVDATISVDGDTVVFSADVASDDTEDLPGLCPPAPQRNYVYQIRVASGNQSWIVDRGSGMATILRPIAGPVEE